MSYILICSALINEDHIRNFDSEHSKLFRNKSSAPKFKSALIEARKKAKEHVPLSPKTISKLIRFWYFLIIFIQTRYGCQKERKTAKNKAF